MKLLRKHPLAITLIALYVALLISTLVYALSCQTQWCSLILVIPLTPWPQLASLTNLDLPQFLLPLGALLNLIIIFYLGLGIEKLLKVNS